MLVAQLARLIFLCFFTLECVVERVLSVLNARYAQAHAHTIPPELSATLDAQTHRKSVDYTLARTAFGHVAAIEGALLKLLFLFSGALPWLARQSAEMAPGDYSSAVLFLLAFALLSALASTPLDLYGTFVLEAKFGFNKTSLKMWLLDRVKGALLGVALGVPFMLAVLWLTLNSGPLWWLWAGLFVIAFQFLMLLLYPALIAPLFNKFEPLPDGELKQTVHELAARCGFAVGGIYTMDGSRRSGHSNAYFTGLGNARRIVLFDTLVQQMTTAELSAVLAHEIGHYKLRHIPKTLVLGIVLTLGGFFALSLLLHWPVLYEVFGGGAWPVDAHTALGVAQGLLLCSMIAGPLTFWSGPLMHALSRKYEYEADAYAVKQVSAEPLRGALLKLHAKNLSNPTPHPWYSAYYYSHPALVERLGAFGGDDKVTR